MKWLILLLIAIISISGCVGTTTNITTITTTTTSTRITSTTISPTTITTTSTTILEKVSGPSDEYYSSQFISVRCPSPCLYSNEVLERFGELQDSLANNLNNLLWKKEEKIVYIIDEGSAYAALNEIHTVPYGTWYREGDKTVRIRDDPNIVVCEAHEIVHTYLAFPVWFHEGAVDIIGYNYFSNCGPFKDSSIMDSPVYQYFGPWVNGEITFEELLDLTGFKNHPSEISCDYCHVKGDLLYLIMQNPYVLDCGGGCFVNYLKCKREKYGDVPIPDSLLAQNFYECTNKDLAKYMRMMGMNP